MKLSFSFLLFLFTFSSCVEKSKSSIDQLVDSKSISLLVPAHTIGKSNLKYHRNTSVWTLKDTLYSGYAVSYYPDHTRKEKFGILNGKKQNIAEEWFSDGRMKSSTFYSAGKLNGAKKFWSADSLHILISHLNYSSGKLHGIQKKWYPSGEIFKILNLNMGKEEGIQKAYRKNGDLFANYEAKNGRIFGLKRASLCFGLEDEKVIYED